MQLTGSAPVKNRGPAADPGVLLIVGGVNGGGEVRRVNDADVSYIPTRMLLVVFRSANSGVGYVEIGSEYLRKNWGGKISLLPSERAISVSFDNYFCAPPEELKAAYEEFELLGDVFPDPRDFKTRWYDPAEALPAVAELMARRSRKARTLLVESVVAELRRVRFVLTEIARVRGSFYLTEAYEDTDRTFAGSEWVVKQENDGMQLTRAAQAAQRGPRS